MRVSACLLTRTRPDAEHVCLLDPVLLIGKPGIQGPHCKCVAPRPFVKVRADRDVKRTQCLVIEVIQKIPEKAEIKPCTVRKTKRIFEVPDHLFLGHIL